MIKHDQKHDQTTILFLVLVFSPSSAKPIIYIDGLVYDCSNSIANALELLQCYNKPSICYLKLLIITSADILTSSSVRPSVDTVISTEYKSRYVLFEFSLSITLILAKWHYMVTEIWVNIGSGNGLLPYGTKPLPEPILTSR